MISEPCPLAIIGISCLFPKADSLQVYWANIKNGVDAITPIPKGSHWNVGDYFNSDPKSPDRTYAQRGGFIPAVDFNPMEFGISPKDIEATDTTQLLGMIAAKQALLDAGYGKDRSFNREKTSVILGVTGALELVIPLGARLGHPIWRKALQESGVEETVAEDVIQRISDSYVGWQENSFPGLLGNVAAGRIASRLDLGGTNCVVDAACASSMAALHLASLELASGRSDMVITGGIDTFNDIFMYMCFSKTPALSPTGDAKPFDRDCDGTILGEGLGMMILKRLDDAERDGDRIYAVLKGIGSSSDGRGNAIYAPRVEGQKLALERAYECAGIGTETIELIEAHGTGTKVGDATEVRSLVEVFDKKKSEAAPCAVGSVKSQIGHTKAAAGVAGLIKTALALHHKVLPPTIKVNQPVEELAPGKTQFYVNTRKRPWMPVDQHPRRAGVSSFGFGGTNFHCILEEHPNLKPEVDWDGDVEILVFSDESVDGLKGQVKAWETGQSWLDFRRQAFNSRKTFQPAAAHRLSFVVSREADRAALKDTALKMLEKNAGKSFWTAPTGISYGSGKRHGKLGALFPGQGSQYIGMMRDLACQFPCVMDALNEANHVFEAEHPGTERLSDFIYPQPAFAEEARRSQESALKATDIAQPALGAVSIGAFNALGYFKVAPEAACGHSYGELLALCGAGRIKPEALHRLSNVRGRLMAKRPDHGDRGAMLAVQADEESVMRFVDAEKSPLVIANRNSPSQFVLAGPVALIEKAAGEFEKRSIRTRKLPVAAAFHSPLVADARQPFAEALQKIQFNKGCIPVYANATGREYPQADSEARELLASQIVRPVNFMDQVRAMYEDGVRTFIEVGPGHVLSDLVSSILSGRDVETIAMDASKGSRSGIFDLAVALSRLAVLGHETDLSLWEQAPPAETIQKGMAMPLCGANHRSPRTSRPAVSAKPQSEKNDFPRTTMAAPVSIQNKTLTQTASSIPPVTGAISSREPVNIPSEGRGIRDAVLALQRLQEQTAQLHRQFLEGQDSARRSIEALLGLQQHPYHFAASSPAPLSISRQEPIAPVIDRSSTANAVPAIPVAKAEFVVTPSPLPAVKAVDKTRFETAVLAVVAEKTGYPVEMLGLDMGLDSDLGIDSIKRVEIMAALRARLPEAPEIKPDHLGTLQTLKQVVDFLSSGTSAGVSAPPAPAADAGCVSNQKIETALLEVVAEKTGYPVEMLNLSMGMDSDLGIDSIKRVEIMAALKTKLPEAPEIKPEHLGTLQTLQQVVDFLSQGNSPKSGASSKPAGIADVSIVSSALLEVVAEKTGYPVEMLNLGMGLDSDLGIDSIKRVEIMAGLKAKLPDAPEIKPEHLGTLQTLQQIVDFLSTSTPASKPEQAAVKTVSAVKSSRVGVMRQIVRPVPIRQLGERQKIKLKAGSVLWLAADQSEFSNLVESQLQQKGFSIVHDEIEKLLTKSEIPAPAGLIILASQTSSDDRFIKNAFQLMQKGASPLNESAQSGALLCAISRQDGSFGFGNGPDKGSAISGGLAGLIKTAAREWPEIACKAIDLHPDSAALAAVANEVIDELFLAGPVEVGIRGTQRVSLEIVTEALSGESPISKKSKDEVWVISGGARGITAELAVAMAKSFQPTLVLLGRTVLPESEPDWLLKLHTEQEIKKALFAHLNGDGSPKVVEIKYREIIARREIRQQLHQIKSWGSPVCYKSLDVRDAAAVSSALAEVERQYGSITGLVHGAGVLADRRIEDKTLDQFDLVYDTKVCGLRHLLQALDKTKLQNIVLFSSYTGRFGRIGQIDYAAANEVLNKMAQAEAISRQGCKVISINWGPWNGGMVTPALKTVFEKEGVGLIEIEDGVQFLLRELVSSSKDVEILALAPASKSSGTAIKKMEAAEDKAELNGVAAFKLEVGVHSMPCLKSHVFNGHAVLPAALMMEWLAAAAIHENPGMICHGLDLFKVLKGIVLEENQNVSVSLMTSSPVQRNGLRMIPVRLISRTNGHTVVHASAEVLLSNDSLTERPKPTLNPISSGGYDHVYAKSVLFHGPELHGIQQVDGCAEEGIVARVKNAPQPKLWLSNPLRNSWITDPLVVDSVFQMLILWSQSHRGGPSLPCGIQSYRQYASAFPKNGCRIVISTAGAAQTLVASHFEILDMQGNLVASAQGCECVVDTSLEAAFRLNRLKLED